MTWNYRMTRRTVETPTGPERVFEIREVYYGSNGELSWTANAIAPSGETWQECGDMLSMMGRALGAHILDLDTTEWLSPLTLTREQTRKPWTPPEGVDPAVRTPGPIA